jgi:hypothetical protein
MQYYLYKNTSVAKENTLNPSLREYSNALVSQKYYVSL